MYEPPTKFYSLASSENALESVPMRACWLMLSEHSKTLLCSVAGIPRAEYLPLLQHPWEWIPENYRAGIMWVFAWRMMHAHEKGGEMMSAPGGLLYPTGRTCAWSKWEPEVQSLTCTNEKAHQAFKQKCPFCSECPEYERAPGSDDFIDEPLPESLKRQAD